MRCPLPLSIYCFAALSAIGLAGQPQVELKNHDGHVWQGRDLAHNEALCWLEQRDGQISKIELKSIIGMAKLPQDFRPMTVVDLRPELSKEFGRKFEYQTRGAYVVAAPPGMAKTYADLLDGVHRGYWHYFSRRSFGLTQPTFPLVAIIFPSQEEFAAYAKVDGIVATPTLKGYYSPQTNRIAFFQEADVRKVTTLTAPKTVNELLLARKTPQAPCWHDEFATPLVIEAADPQPFQAGSFWAVDSDTQDTLVHEATHQLAFNTGLHSRIGTTPRWLAEGLAMMFEVQLNKAAPDGPRGGKINQERLEWFVKSRSTRRHTVDQLIADDDPMFAQSALDAYAESWSFAYFLSETRAPMFSKYLKRVSQRTPLEEYNSQARIEDFQAEFGTDLKRIEVEFLRYIDSID